jgi:hypothetical protein
LNGCNLNSSWVDGTPEVGCKSTMSSSIAPAWSAESSASVQHSAWSMMWLLVYLLDLNKFPPSGCTIRPITCTLYLMNKLLKITHVIAAAIRQSQQAEEV